MPMQIPGAEVFARFVFKAKQVISLDDRLLAQLTLLLRNLLELGLFFHLGMCVELTGNRQRWKTQPFLQCRGNM